MIGDQVAGYQLTGVLGQGSQATVFAARHHSGRDVALKLLLPQLARDPDRVRRFFDEARAAASVRHPGVVEVYECGQDEQGRVFIAMEKLSGETLFDRLRRSPLATGEALAVLRQLAAALAAAHDHCDGSGAPAPIVHRDLKPENVFLVTSGESAVVKIVDFGIAKLAPALRSGGTLTGAGIFGTPPYMSPEQCRGEPADHRADVYALGCLLYEMLTGTPPFGYGGVGDLLHAHCHEEPPPLSHGCHDVPADLDSFAARLLAKTPDDRPQSCRELVALADHLGASADIAAPPRRQQPIATLVDVAHAPSRGWRSRAWERALRLSPWMVAGVACLVGCLMLALSIVLGVGDSYGAAPNWGLTYAVLSPLILSFLIKGVQRCDEALREMAARGMVQVPDGVIAATAVKAAAARLGAGLVALVAVLVPVAVAVSVAEWAHRYGQEPIAGTFWTESAVMGTVGAVCQGLLIALILGFAVHAVAWSHLLYEWASPRSALRLRDDPASADRRRGYEVLEEPLVLLLITGALILLVLYLSNVQHLAEVRGQSLPGVLFPGVERLAWTGPHGLLDAGGGRYPSATVMLASALVAAFLLTAAFLIRRAARVWPLRLGVAALPALLIAAVVGTLLYRVGLIAALLVALAMLGRALLGLRGSAGGPPNPS